MMMKKILIAGLLTATMLSAVSPASAQWQGRGDQETGRYDGGRDAGTQGRRDTGYGERERGWQRGPVPAPSVQPAPSAPAPRDIGPQGRGDDGRNGRPAWNGNTGVVPPHLSQRDDRRGDDRNRADQWHRDSDRRDNNRPVDNRWQRDHGGRGNDWNRYHGHDNNWQRDHRDRDRWSHDWRNDRRYDWREYRNRYRTIYRAPRYYAPRGWGYGYRPFSAGIYLYSGLFNNSYWIEDTYRYRLPQAYGTLRWVRYYDDALLVDIRDGYVVDVIRDFFW